MSFVANVTVVGVFAKPPHKRLHAIGKLMHSLWYAARMPKRRFLMVLLVEPLATHRLTVHSTPGATNGVDIFVALFVCRSPDKHSDIRVSARVLDLLGSGVGNGAVGVTYRRDLDTVQVSGGAIFGQCYCCVFWEG